MESKNATTEKSPLISKDAASTFTHGSQKSGATESSNDSYGQIDQLFVDEADVDIDDDDVTFVEHFYEQYQEVVDVVVDELQDVDDDETVHYLELGLTRNCALLPSDVIDAAEVQQQTPLETTDEDVEVGSEPQEPVKAPAIPLSAYLLLLSAVISISAIGPLLQLQVGVSPTMKIVWRQAATGLLLVPLAAVDFYRSGFPSLTGPQWFTFLLSTISYDIFTTSLALALSYTSVGNAVILGNSLALILLIGKFFVGDPVSLLEGSGAIVAFAGAALCSKDSERSERSNNGLLGDAIAIFSAVGGVGYLVFAKSTRQHMPMYIFMFLIMVVGTALLIVFQIVVLREKVTFDMHPNYGVWGFLNVDADRLPLEVVMAFICNCCGTMGYVRAMQYFDNLVISSAALVEPVVAEFMAFFFGVGTLPGIQGWIGNALVALGTFAVIYKDSAGKGMH